jgi:hypothetical protein
MSDWGVRLEECSRPHHPPRWGALRPPIEQQNAVVGQHSAPLKAPQLALGVNKASVSAGNPRVAATDDARQRGAAELRLLLPADKASVWRVGARTTGRRPTQERSRSAWLLSYPHRSTRVERLADLGLTRDTGT